MSLHPKRRGLALRAIAAAAAEPPEVARNVIHGALMLAMKHLDPEIYKAADHALKTSMSGAGPAAPGKAST